VSTQHQLVLMPRKGVTKSERHRVHAIRTDGAPLCGGGFQAKSAPAWQDDIGPVNCGACLAILERKAKRQAKA
jgi:hypothetical protein